jgi:hypothetical protein
MSKTPINGVTASARMTSRSRGPYDVVGGLEVVSIISPDVPCLPMISFATLMAVH